MRVRGDSQAEIVRYLNSRKDYQVFKYKQGGHTDYHWDKDSVSKVLSDPTFAGIIRYSGGISNLIEKYDFEPAVSAENFLMINKAKDFMSSKFKSAITSPKEGAQADLLRGLIYCQHCGKSLSSGITVKKDVNYYRYRCETDGCKMKNKGPRAKTVTDFAINYLDEYRFTTQSNYENYAKEVAASRKAKLGELTRLLASVDKQILERRKITTMLRKL
jgi:transcription elongation factor Elf1